MVLLIARTRQQLLLVIVAGSWRVRMVMSPGVVVTLLAITTTTIIILLRTTTPLRRRLTTRVVFEYLVATALILDPRSITAVGRLEIQQGPMERLPDRLFFFLDQEVVEEERVVDAGFLFRVVLRVSALVCIFRIIAIGHHLFCVRFG